MIAGEKVANTGINTNAFYRLCKKVIKNDKLI